jgi:hypothetical protein
MPCLRAFYFVDRIGKEILLFKYLEVAMRPEQIQDNINQLISLERDCRLSRKETIRIRQILMSHQIKKFDFNSLYLISANLCARDLRKLAIVLLRHKVFLRCGICGEYIRSTSIYSVDHIFPLSLDGRDILDNIQHSHEVCNSIKADETGFVSFYNNPESIEEYVLSDTYQELIERRGNKHKVTGNDFAKPLHRYDLSTHRYSYSR